MDKKTFEEIITKTHSVIERLDLMSVCICGSSRFCDLIAVVKWELEKKGIIATGLHLLPQWYIENREWVESHHGAEQENVAHVLDELHLRKIDSCGSVIIVNPNNYIGERTAIEIEYAKSKDKPIFYWEVKNKK
jgi:hypothetical protein